MHHDRMEFHNVAQRRAIDGRDGRLLQRVPERVRTDLNEGAQSRMRHPAGVELRFVPEDTVELTLSVLPGGSADSGTVRVFWGPLEAPRSVEIGPAPRTIELSMPETVAGLDPAAVAALDYHPRVCRVRLPGEHRGGYTLYHGASGERRPPAADELPDRRYLAYGTSITEGEAPSGEHLTYVNGTARRLGADPINLGSCGTAYCDAAMADHIAARGDWDVATLSLSINMVGEFPPETFRERAERMVETVAAARPEAPVACITLFPNVHDVTDDGSGVTCERFRAALRSIVDESGHDNVVLLEGTELLPDVAGLTTDLVHPGDHGMTTIATNLATELEALLDG